MGMVFLAQDLNLERPVALKVMKPSLAAQSIHQQRFLREAKATAALRDDYIVTIYHVGEERGVPFLAMELLEGLPMDKWLSRGRKPTVSQILRLGRQTALGLAAAHEKGLVHRDIKPANLWIDSSAGGRIKILDFGLARPSDDAQLTQTGMILGTPAFMSPEQARGLKLDFRSDLFSLGCVLYRLVAGKIPFSGESTMAVLTALAVDVPRPVREVNAEIPRPLEELIDQLLQKNPEDRPASARAVANQLIAIEKELSGSATHVLLPAAATSAPSRTLTLADTLVAAAAPVKTVVPIAKPVRPRRWGWQFWLVAAIAGVLLAVVIHLLRHPEGTLVVNVQDSNLELTIRSGEKVLAMHSRGRQFQLNEGAGSIEIFDRGNQRLTRVAFHIGRSETLVLQLDEEVAQARRQLVPHRSLRVFAALDPAWLKEVKGLAEPLRLPLVEAELQRRNPDFRGTLLFQPLPERGVGLEIREARRLEDLTPLVMLPQLRRLAIYGAQGRQPLDLTPLRELRLVELCLWKTPVASLESLQGMPLEGLELSGSKLLPLMPLQNIKSLKT
ncbi:MAG TPA: serine/threonine-protein kinase, partial [Streptosporangiaceae bacterium]|nr:serine/threonine-protein kinase [Streptosporangiaceae bacterium]